MHLDRIEKGDLVAVAMSGGVDSSVAACLAVESGYRVIGITLQLYDQGVFSGKKKACCAGQDIYDARCVADRMGFAHYVLDYESIFKEHVIEDFAQSYLKGHTPLPCVRCNQKVKFQDLLKMSQGLGAKALITGHYVRRFEGSPPQMHRALDPKKDQSYFLFATTLEQLDYLRFPLGGWSKEVTRQHAERFNLEVSNKPDSQDICFVPTGGYAEVVKRLHPQALDPGAIVHIDGTLLGTHKGIIHYTIGQRKGLGISSGEPLFVIRLDAKKKEVIVGPRDALAVQKIILDDVNWLSPIPLNEGVECLVKLRSTSFPVKALVTNQGKATLVELEQSEYGISLGQACVFYKADRVLGGGWMASCS